MIPIHETARGITFQIQVLPRSSRCAVAGIQGDCLKIKITAPPVEGKANEECIRFLAAALGIKKARISIVRGLAARKKTIAIEDMTKKDAEAVLRCLSGQE